MNGLLLKESKVDMRDLPISNCQDDLLEIDMHATALAEFVKHAYTPLTISLQGEWGCGKTSLMKLLEKKLCEKSTDKGFESIWINTWEFFLNNNQEQAIQNVIMAITKEITLLAKQKDDDYSVDINDIFDKLKNYAVNSANVVMSVFGADEKSRSNLFNSMDINSISAIKGLRRSLESLITKLVQNTENEVSNQGFVIFIDDMDRIDPEVVVNLLEVFKNLFDINYCVFVLAIDYDVVVKGLKSRYGEQNNENKVYFQQYFDKLVQLPFVMPVEYYKIEGIIKSLLEQVGYFVKDKDITIEVMEQIVYTIKATIGNNPRRIKRLVNALHLSIIYDRSKHNYLSDIDNKVLNLIFVCLQQAYPDIYSMLVKYPDYKKWRMIDFPGLIDHNDRDLDMLEDTHGNVQWKKVICKFCLKNEHLKNRMSGIINIFNILSKSDFYTDCQFGEIGNILSLSKFTRIGSFQETKLRYDGQAYDGSSKTQFDQGSGLLDQIDLQPGMEILDVGCGNGKVTIELYRKEPTVRISAFDLSKSQIDIAKEKLTESNIDSEKILFFVADATEFESSKKYDLIFSNATLHWIIDSKSMYQKLYKLLKKGGQLAVHQGGYNSYKGLHIMVKKAIENLSYEEYYDGWSFPVFYPTKKVMEEMLREIGFDAIRVISKESDGTEHPDLVENFANASLLPYLDRLPEENRQKLKDEYMHLCSRESVSLYTHRLYIFAERNY